MTPTSLVAGQHGRPVPPIASVRWPIALTLSLLAVMPFLFVAIPPLTDVPGHMGRLSVQTASAGDQIFRYYGFHWSLTLNLASDIIVQSLHRWVSIPSLMWTMCAATAFLTALGIVAVARASNPRGASAVPWALLFVFNWPFLWGFLNFSLTFAWALLALAGWIALEHRPRWRSLLFMPVPPLLLIGHGVAGMVGVGVIVSYSIGDALLKAERRPAAAMRRSMASLSPLIASAAATIIVWKVFGSPEKGRTVWLFDRKTESLIMMLRDQNEWLDIGTVVACLAVGLLGWRWGARLKGGSAAAVLFVTTLFVATPSLISGSDRIDTRLAPLIPMLFFAMQDWSTVRANRRRFVLALGFSLVAVRWGVTSFSFADYNQRYQLELTALRHVPPGSRVLNLSRVDCPEVAWRSERLEHLSNLATMLRGAWVNSHWSIDGLQLLSVRYQPSPAYVSDPSHLIWPARCVDFREPFSRRVRHTLAESMPVLPIDKVDFVWLIGERLPPGQRDRRLTRVWADDISELYAVRAHS